MGPILDERDDPVCDSYFDLRCFLWVNPAAHIVRLRGRYAAQVKALGNLARNRPTEPEDDAQRRSSVRYRTYV